MNIAEALFLVQVVTTLPMVGLILIVQVVVYPQFANVPADSFVAYHNFHMRRITPVVALFFLPEMAASAAMILWRPEWISLPEAALGLALTVVLIMSTLFLQIPCHNKLSAGYNRTQIELLVRTNFVRTLAWCARGVLVTCWLVRYGAAL
jgi:hypothetical protein